MISYFIIFCLYARSKIVLQNLKNDQIIDIFLIYEIKLLLHTFEKLNWPTFTKKYETNFTHLLLSNIKL